MKVLIWGSFLFCMGFFLHFLIWKIRLPKYQTKAILKIYIFTFLGWLVSCLMLRNLGLDERFFIPINNYEYMHILFFVAVLTISYIVFYSAIEVDSPSLLITQAIANAGDNGLDKKSLEDQLNDQVLVIPRINDLIYDKMAILENGRYRVSPKGMRLLRLVFIHRSMLGISTKGG